jgi:isopenicillin N synthase-like dioxygenase
MVFEMRELSVAIIDIAPLVASTAGRVQTGGQIGKACRECGFFYMAGHGLDDSLCLHLELSSIFRHGPLRYSDLAHLVTDILP